MRVFVDEIWLLLVVLCCFLLGSSVWLVDG